MASHGDTHDTDADESNARGSGGDQFHRAHRSQCPSLGIGNLKTETKEIDQTGYRFSFREMKGVSIG